MDKEMKDRLENTIDEEQVEQQETRREFFSGLGKWSKIIIGAALIGGLTLPKDSDARWGNHGGGGGWRNGGWRNGGWHNGGWRNGGWRNGGWYNGGWWNGGWWNGGWSNFYGASRRVR
jgi:hypothetical protein